MGRMLGVLIAVAIIAFLIYRMLAGGPGTSSTGRDAGGMVEQGKQATRQLRDIESQHQKKLEEVMDRKP